MKSTEYRKFGLSAFGGSSLRGECRRSTRSLDLQRSERGLTTLEWLLIVAAVAGLAALAVVLVQNVVDDTAEEISGNNARITAAKVAADRITGDAIDDIVRTADGGTQIADAELEAINSEFESKCNRRNITYSDADVKVSGWATFVGTSPMSNSVTVARIMLEAQDPKGCVLAQ